MEPFIGIIMPVAFGYAPKGWNVCNGQTIAITANPALFSLIGTTFGGNGTTTFMLPNLVGRIPVGAGRGSDRAVNLGEVGGAESVTLNSLQMPQHSHTMTASSASVDTPFSRSATLASNAMYGPLSGGVVNMDPSTISTTGNNQPHDNHSPYLVINWLIALVGIFPSRP